MKSKSPMYLYKKFCIKKDFFPLNGHVELTYRCYLNCIHCYCKGLELKKNKGKDRELNTNEFKKIIDEIQKEGCLYLTLTGGDPLLREDFLEIYAYAKEKGFLITIFTTGQTFTEKIINFLTKSPPHSIEITLNGITQDTYETITQVKGSYFKAIQAIRLLKKKNLPLILKSNCLKQNKHEIAKVKRFTEQLLGRLTKNRYRFKYDPFIEPKLNGDRSVCDLRISFEELVKVRKQDKDFWREFRQMLHNDIPDFDRDRDYLYGCNAWMNQFFINPYGRLKFCILSDKFSIDLKTTPFRKGFYEEFPKILDEKFKTNSKCHDCSLRSICHNCPARAYLETGDEEAPVEYYCQLAEAASEQYRLAKETAKHMSVTRHTSHVSR